MNPMDWIALSVALITLVGFTFDGADPKQANYRATPGQVAAARAPEAGLVVGGEMVMRFTDSGVMAAEDRAREAKLNLRRAIETYGLPRAYLGPALRGGGMGDVAEVAYLDMRITTVTAADAKAAGASSPAALAGRWRDDLDRAIRGLPSPMPDGWIASATGGGGGGGRGAGVGRVLVSDETLAEAAAASIDYGVGRRVSVSAADGVVRLEGKVGTAEDRARLVRLMKDLPGVRGVDDRLTVGP